MAVTPHLHSIGGNTLKGTISIFSPTPSRDIATLILSLGLLEMSKSNVSALLWLMLSEGTMWEDSKNKKEAQNRFGSKPRQ